MKFLSSLSLLCLLSASSYPGSVGAVDLSKRGSLKPFSDARLSLSKEPGKENVQVTRSLLSPRNLFSRRDVCPPGTLPCLINDKCCAGECCLDDTCCDAVEDCFNDLSSSVGPSYCCKRYTETDCDGGGCMPFDGNCCGGGRYCEWDHYCTDTGCCENGELCTPSGDDDDDDDSDDDNNNPAPTTKPPPEPSPEPPPTEPPREPSPEPTPTEPTSSSSTSTSTSSSSSTSTSSNSSSSSGGSITGMPSLPPGGGSSSDDPSGGGNTFAGGAASVGITSFGNVVVVMLAIVVGARVAI